MGMEVMVVMGGLTVVIVVRTGRMVISGNLVLGGGTTLPP